jgi:hypothetical protein
MRPRRKGSLRTWLAVATGTAATWGMAVVGWGALQRSLGADRDTWEYFLDEGRLAAPIGETEFFSSPRAGHSGAMPHVAPEFLGLLADERAEEKLEQLVFAGAPGARVYGLCGLRILGSHRLGLDSWSVARSDHRRVALAEGGSLSVTTPHDLVGTATFDGICAGWQEVHLAAARSRLID